MKRIVAVGLPAALATLIVLLTGAPAAADPHGDQVRVDRQLVRTRAALESASVRVVAAAAALDDANRRLPPAQRELAEAEGVLAGAHARADTAARTVHAAQVNLAAADRALTLASRRVDQTRTAIGAYATRAYETGDVAGVSALLSVTSPADFVAGLSYLEHVAQAQQQALQANTLARAEQKNRQNTLAGRRRDAVAAAKEAADAVDRAAAAQATAAARHQAVAGLVAQRTAALGVAQADRAATLKQYQELQAESARIAAEIRGLAKSGGPVLRRGARLPMPVVGWKSSDFGMRYDPFYRVWQLHAGVDFAAPQGTPIWAAAAGRVVRAGWDGGYGNYTCLYHGTYQGKAFATCYAHQSAILVRVGQQVRAGQVIGRVGTTGASTGDHLHFEVRLDGTPVNPVSWLPACLC